MSDKITIFDTTLRDGEQTPGASMTIREKIDVARQLERLGVDVIEAGFPVISDGDFEAVTAIASELQKPIIAGLARCVEKDIRAAGKAVAPAGRRGRIHVFLATSKIHREFKLRKASDEIIRIAVENVQLAKSLCDDIEFSPEDASRTEPEFLAEVTEAVIAAGATTVNIPDTVGYAVPEEYAKLIRHLREKYRTSQTRSSASIATTTSASRSPTRWLPSGRGHGRSSARSMVSANARATPRWKRSSWG